MASEQDIITPRPRPVQPITAIEVPVQPDASHGIEWKNSGNLSEDIQRFTTVLEFIFAGRPDQVAIDASLGNFKLGYPHPWQPDMFVIHAKFEHYLYGPDPDSGRQTPTTQRDSKNYTKVIITYRQMPCPGKWEEQGGVTLISRLEWYDRRDPGPNTLRGTHEGIPLLVPQPTYKRHFPKVFLSAAKYHEIQSEIGKTNGVPEGGWRGYPNGTWLFESWLPKLLFGDSANTAAYELTLMWRADPERRHQWWVPLTDGDSYRPLPSRPDESRTEFFARVFTRRTLYEQSAKNWDDLVPLRGTPCDPPATS